MAFLLLPRGAPFSRKKEKKCDFRSFTMAQDVVEAGLVAPFLLRSRPDDRPHVEGKTHQKGLTKLEPYLIIN